MPGRGTAVTSSPGCATAGAAAGGARTAIPTASGAGRTARCAPPGSRGSCWPRGLRPLSRADIFPAGNGGRLPAGIISSSRAWRRGPAAASGRAGAGGGAGRPSPHQLHQLRQHRDDAVQPLQYLPVPRVPLRVRRGGHVRACSSGMPGAVSSVMKIISAAGVKIFPAAGTGHTLRRARSRGLCLRRWDPLGPGRRDHAGARGQHVRAGTSARGGPGLRAAGALPRPGPAVRGGAGPPLRPGSPRGRGLGMARSPPVTVPRPSGCWPPWPLAAAVRAVGALSAPGTGKSGGGRPG